MQRRRRWAHAAMMLTATAAMIATLLTGGCGGTQTTGGGADAIAAYQAGRYAVALAAAKQQADAATGAERQRYRYIAGMSAYQLKKDDEALRYLTAVTGESDNAIAGPASATAGLIYARNHKYAQAMPYFEAATKKLTGEDQAQAYFHLGSTQQKLGQWAPAKLSLEKAASLSHSSTFKEAARQRMSSTSFTVQVGSYSLRTNAEKHAASLRANAEKRGYGAPRVVPANTSVGITYLVHVGQFPTYDAANAAKTSLGESEALIVDAKP